MKKLIILLSVSGLALIGCGSESDSSSQGVQNLEQLSLNFQTISPRHKWVMPYSAAISKALDESPVNNILDYSISKRDLEMLGCSEYDSATIEEKKIFWILFMASIAHAESSLNPNTTFREKNGTLSSGLLQIDVLAANAHSKRYTGKNIGQTELFDPQMNLKLGLYIMNHQLNGGIRGERADIAGRLFTDRHYYWSVLTLKRALIIKTFKHNSAKNLPFCHASSSI